MTRWREQIDFVIKLGTVLGDDAIVLRHGTLERLKILLETLPQIGSLDRDVTIGASKYFDIQYSD